MNIQLPEYVRDAVRATWQAIGPDFENGCVMEEGVDEPLICQAEACIDSNMLSVYGGEHGVAADKEINELMDAHGQDVVLRAVADQCF